LNELQIFAFIVLPLTIAAVAFIGGYLTNRKYDKRDRHKAAE
jgi:hypothetical protein